MSTIFTINKKDNAPAVESNVELHFCDFNLRQWKSQGAKVLGNEMSRERKGQGVNWPWSYWLIRCRERKGSVSRTLNLIPTLTVVTLLTLIVPVIRRNLPLFDDQSHKNIPTMSYLRMHCIMNYWLSACDRPNWLSQCLVFSAYTSDSRCGVTGIICPVPNM